MIHRSGRAVTVTFVLFVGLVAVALAGCGPRVGAAAGAATPSDEQTDAERAKGESNADTDSDANTRDADLTNESNDTGRAVDDPDDVEPFANAKSESKDVAEPERDAKGKKKLKLPDKVREPSLNKAPSKPKSAS